MRPVGRTQVFAQLVEADIHQLDRIDGIFSVPGIDRAVGGLALKGEDRADRGVVLQAVAGGQPVADMKVQDRVEPARTR
jgi:hypothetical protein